MWALCVNEAIGISMSEIVQSILEGHRSILGNLEWNLGGIVGLATIVIEPKIINLQNVPRVISINGLELDGFQCYGLTLRNIERKDRSNEIIATAKRSLICESLEIIAENMARVARVVNGGDDPLITNDYFNADIRELWNGNNGKSDYSYLTMSKLVMMSFIFKKVLSTLRLLTEFWFKCNTRMKIQRNIGSIFLNPILQDVQLKC